MQNVHSSVKLLPLFLILLTGIGCMDPFLRPDPPFTDLALELVLGNPGSRNLQAPQDFQGKIITIELRRNSATGTLIDSLSQTLGAPSSAGSFTINLEFKQVPTSVDLVLVGMLQDGDSLSTCYFRGVSNGFRADPRGVEPVSLQLERVDYSSQTNGYLSSFYFSSSLNSNLTTNIVGQISHDTGSVQVVFPTGTNATVLSNLSPTFAHTGVQALLEGTSLISSQTLADFSQHPNLILMDGQGGSKTYQIVSLIQGTLQVFFHANGGSGAMDPMSSNETILTLITNGFTKSGSTFVGWNTKADGSGIDYSDGADIPVTTGVVDLYAQWEGEYTIVYYLNGGNDDHGNPTAYYVTSPTFTLAHPTRSGYTFSGWYDNPAFTGSPITEVVLGSSGNREMYAQWEAMTFTLQLDKQGGTEGTNSVFVTFGMHLPTAAQPFKNGHIFNGYWDEVSGGNQYYDSGMVSVMIWDKTELNPILYARWMPEIYTITYLANGSLSGTIPSPVMLPYNTDVNLSQNVGNLIGPEVSGEHAGRGIKQRFLGWDPNPSALTPTYLPGSNYVLTSDITLYAIYTNDDTALRKIGPAGGWIFYDHGSNAIWGRYLEVWIADEPTTYQWKTSLTETPGTSVDLGTGYANTYSYMIGTEHPAAEIARNVSYGSYNDWFLPSSGEIVFLYSNLHSQGLGNFELSYYRTSSESRTEDEPPHSIPANHAHLYHFEGSGYFHYYPQKTNFNRVRVIRKF